MFLSKNTQVDVIDLKEFDLPVLEGYAFEDAGDIQAYTEFHEDMVGVYEAMHNADMQEIELRKEHGGVALESINEAVLESFMPVMEGANDSVWEKMITSIKRLWAKLQAWLKSARTRLESLIQNGREFATQHEQQIMTNIREGKLDKVEREMYRYKDSVIDQVSSPFVSYNHIIHTKLNTSQDKDFEDIDATFYQKLRNDLSGVATADKFREAVRKTMRSEQKEKVLVKDVAKDFLKVIKDGNSIKSLKSIEATMNKEFAAEIKEIQSYKTKDNKGMVDVCRKRMGVVQGCMNICTTYVREWQTICEERERTYVSVLTTAAAARTPKKEA